MKTNRKLILLFVGLVIVFIVDFPIIAVALNSFRTTETIISSHSILPTNPTLTNYVYINTRTSFRTFLLNSEIVALTSSALGIVLAALAAFAMSRFHARILGSYNQALLTDWGSLMASATLGMVPTLILFLLIQKYMVSGATAGAG